MKYLTLLLLFVCSSVMAAPTPDNPCDVTGGVPTYFYSDISTGGAYACAPAPRGTGTMPTVRINAAGAVVWWYCPMPGGKWTVNWAAGTVAELSSIALLTDLYNVATAADPFTALTAAAKKNVTLPLNDPSLAAVWCPTQQEMFAGAPAPATWTVAPNGTLPDRAAFAVVNGKRSYGSTSRVSVGAACDCSAISLSEGNTTYCQVAAAVVSVCTKP